MVNKIIFNTFYKTLFNKTTKFIKKSYTLINITTREINIYILTIRAKYNKTLFYKKTSTKRQKLKGILLLLLLTVIFLLILL